MATARADNGTSLELSQPRLFHIAGSERCDVSRSAFEGIDSDRSLARAQA